MIYLARSLELRDPLTHGEDRKTSSCEAIEWSDQRGCYVDTYSTAPSRNILSNTLWTVPLVDRKLMCGVECEEPWCPFAAAERSASLTARVTVFTTLLDDAGRHKLCCKVYKTQYLMLCPWNKWEKLCRSRLAMAHEKGGPAAEGIGLRALTRIVRHPRSSVAIFNPFLPRPCKVVLSPSGDAFFHRMTLALGCETPR